MINRRMGALIALAAVFAALWAACSFIANSYAKSAYGEATASWWGVMGWFMVGGLILSVVAAVASTPTRG